MKLVIRLLCATLMAAICTATATGEPRHRIALLIGSPWSGEENVIQNDLASFRTALANRGLDLSQIKEVSGRLTREQVLKAVRAVSAAAASWDSGEVFLYYTGHGWFSGDSAATARPGLALVRDPDIHNSLYWDELFSALHLPRGVQLILLPDC